MPEFDYVQPESVVFKASAKSQLASTRIWLWATPLITLVVLALTRTIPLGSLAWTAGVMLVVCVAVDLVLRRQLKPGQALVTLHKDGVESASFPGKLLWKDMAGVSVAMANNVATLQLQMLPTPGRADRRNFWTGRNAAKPFIVLTPFSAVDQERLFNEVQRHLQQVVPNAQADNPLVQERQFQERLKALAPHTWMTYALLAINTGVWGLLVLFGGDVLKPSAELLLNWGGNTAFNVQQGQWWRLLSASFLHAGILHLVMNMFGLWVIGKTVERIYGHRVFLLVYLGSALLASAFSLHFSAQYAVSVGASGAVFGIAGALLVAVLQHRKTLPQLFGKQMLSGMGFFVFYSLLQGFAKTGIDNAAHVGGLLAGALMALILPARFDMPRFMAQVRLRSVMALAATTALTVGMVLTAPAATVDLQRAYVGAHKFDSGLQALNAALQPLQQDGKKAKEGLLSAVELDERGRTVHALAFQQAAVLFSEAWLPPGDPRQPLLEEVRRFSGLAVESLAMASVMQPGNAEPQPADPARMDVLQAELKKSSDRMVALAGKKAAGVNAAQQRQP